MEQDIEEHGLISEKYLFISQLHPVAGILTRYKKSDTWFPHL